MSNSAKTVLWLGLFMILAGIIKNWKTFQATLFGASAATPAGPPNGVQHMNIPSSGVCPSGYTKVAGQCVWVSPVNPVPAI